MQQHVLFTKDANEIISTRQVDWRLDEKTKAHGLAGIQQARRTLAACHDQWQGQHQAA